MIVAFAKNKTLHSYLIRLFTWSRWHHCGALTKDGKHVIEATFKYGVVKTPLAKFKARYSEVVFAEIECDDDVAQSFLLSQLGKKYDKRAIVSIVLRLDLENPNKWFCSELVAAASKVFRKSRRARPENLWAISKDIK